MLYECHRISNHRELEHLLIVQDYIEQQKEHQSFIQLALYEGKLP